MISPHRKPSNPTPSAGGEGGTLSLSLSHTLSFSLFLSYPHTHSLALAHTHTLTLTHTPIPLQEAKEAEKQVMDKYLALFKQHSTADERLRAMHEKATLNLKS